MAELIQDISIVVVRFKAVGNAPIMKQNFYKITASNRFQAVVQFLRKELAWKASDPLVRVMSPEQPHSDAYLGWVSSSRTLTSLSRRHWMILWPTYTRYPGPLVILYQANFHTSSHSVLQQKDT